MSDTNETVIDQHFLLEAAVKAFLDVCSEESFAALFKSLVPQLLTFFTTRAGEAAAEDLAQDVMLTVYRKAGQVRDPASFRAWVFTIARNALNRHWTKRARRVKTVDLAEMPERFVASNNQSAGTAGFEFHRWMTFLDSHERAALTLRFIDGCEYHEIAAAQRTPVGTAQWRVFRAKKKLAPHLKQLEIKKRAA